MISLSNGAALAFVDEKGGPKAALAGMRLRSDQAPSNGERSSVGR